MFTLFRISAPSTIHWFQVSSWLALLGLACSTPCHAETLSTEPELLRYETYARMDPDSGHIEVNTRLSLAHWRAQPTTVGFLLNNGLELDSVAGQGVKAHRLRSSDFAPIWNLLEVDVDPSLDEDSITIDLAYRGTLNLAGDIGGVTPQAIELSLETMWHPVPASLDREMVGRLALHLPADWEVVSTAPARLVGGVHQLAIQVPQFDLPLFAAPGLRQWQAGDFKVFSLSADDKEASAVLHAANACGQFLNQRFGDTDPLPPVRMVIVAREEMALARKNFMVLPRMDPSETIGLHSLLCHELAHYWAVSPGALRPDHWMSESFAEYVAALFVRKQFGEAIYQQRITEFARAGRGQGPVWTPDSQGRPSHAAMYQLGPYLLSQLHSRIGDKTFKELLRRYMVYRVRATTDLLGHLGELADAETQRWFTAELAADGS
ncbi:MAG: hypothetical protein LAT56_13700 [Wenzhouxiangella sp.]|nr:hypothetical protein [Wenzhouxiangella sp.]